MKRFQLKQLIKEEIEKILEISPNTFKSAINMSKEKGTDARTRRLGQLYFNKFINTPLLGGKIKEITTSAPQQGRYRQVNIIVEFEYPNTEFVPDSLKYDYIHYDIDNDIYDIDKEINKKDARILSLIAQHINPDTQYKTTNSFRIKGDY